MSEFKNWRNNERVWLKDVVPLNAPFTVNIESSSLCNAKCVYCARSGKRNTSNDMNMPLDLFHKVVLDLQGFENKIKLIDMYNSGEPLCNPNLADMIYEIKMKTGGVAETVGFTTNGFLFTKEKIDNLIASGVDVIRISIQGTDADIIKKICGVSVDFDKFVENIEYLYANRKSCKIRIKIADIALKDDEDRSKFLDIFGNLADSIAIETVLPLFQGVNYDDVDSRIVGRDQQGRNGLVHKNLDVCYRPFIKICVRVDGKITASCCDFEHDVVYGNAYTDNIVDVWNGEIRKNFLKLQLLQKRYEHPFCKKCVIPNDVTNERDILDPYVEEILARM